MLRSIVLAGGIAAFGALGAIASPLTDTYTSFWVFGDSLSDDGNLFAASGNTTPTSPPYFNGRFSNGQVWNERIQKEFIDAGKASDNFAFGGATAVTNTTDTIPDLLAQSTLYQTLGAPYAGTRPLASVWFGANDILDAFAANATNVNVAAIVTAAAVGAADAVGTGVRALATAGVRDFAVWNLPDIGRTPRFAAFLPDSASELASFATGAFNARLDKVIAGLRADQLRVTEIDTFGLFAEVLGQPGDFGFTDTALPCLFPDAQTAAAFNRPQLCENTTGLLYFDPIHPTAAAHAVLADTFVAAVPLPSTGFLLAFGLGLLALRRRAA